MSYPEDDPEELCDLEFIPEFSGLQTANKNPLLALTLFLLRFAGVLLFLNDLPSGIMNLEVQP